jgi:hypothetical protein
MKILNKKRQLFKLAAVSGLLTLLGCSDSGENKTKEPAFQINQNPFPSTYKPIRSF